MEPVDDVVVFNPTGAEVDRAALLEALADTDAVAVGVPPTDTVKLIEGDRVVRTPDRGSLLRLGYPQAVRRSALVEDPGDLSPAEAVLASGGRVRLIPPQGR